VRDAAVAPVEDEVAAVAHEDLAVVQVVVLDRVGKPVLDEREAHLVEARHRGVRPQELVLGQPLRPCSEQFSKETWQDREPLVGRPEREKFIRVPGYLELQLRVLGQDALPVLQVGRRFQ
jgi:hypothetical protein